MTMLTVKRRPLGAPSFANAFEGLFNQAFPENANYHSALNTPAVNIKEDEKAFQLTFAVPGFEKSDFDIKLEKDYIIISGKKEESKETVEQKFSRKEFQIRDFKRTFNLPETVEVNGIEAEYVNGLLHVVLPKKVVNESAVTTKIEIK